MVNEQFYEHSLKIFGLDCLDCVLLHAESNQKLFQCGVCLWIVHSLDTTEEAEQPLQRLNFILQKKYGTDILHDRTTASTLQVQLQAPQSTKKIQKMFVLIAFTLPVGFFFPLFLCWDIICHTQAMRILIYYLICVSHSTTVAPRLRSYSRCMREKSVPERAVSTSCILCVLSKQCAGPCTWLLQVSITIPALLYDIQICLHLPHTQPHPEVITTNWLICEARSEVLRNFHMLLNSKALPPFSLQLPTFCC